MIFDTFPPVKALGAVDRFSFNAGEQSVELRVEAIPATADRYVRLTGRFTGVVLFRFNGELPTVISDQNACDFLREHKASKLLSSVLRKGIWTILYDEDRSRVVSSSVLPTDFRHFSVSTSFFWAEWLCVDAKFEEGEELA